MERVITVINELQQIQLNSYDHFEGEDLRLPISVIKW